MDELTVKRALSGDKESFSNAVMELKDRSYKIAYCYLHNAEDSMDAVCDAVEKAYRNIKKLREPKFFSTWFIRIVINECKSHIRRYGRETELEDTYFKEDKNMAEEYLDLSTILNQLERTDRTMIYMKYYLGYTLDEISGLMDLPLWSVKSRIYSNLKNMRSRLDAEEVGK